MNAKLLELYQQQIKNEFESAYIYLGMAAYFETTPFHGFAQWMHIQAKEETEHAMRLFRHVCDRGHQVELRPIAGQKTAYGSPLEAFKESLAHERLVTQEIHEMYRTAVTLEDFPAQVELQWFINEQVEEERNVQDMIDKIAAAEDRFPAMLAIDRIAGQRDE
ncbi:MAG: ferritin [Opitutales bacterium]|nr:ferritin [Opitutales bacterium]